MLLHTDKQKPEICAVRTAAKTAIFEVQSVDLRFANGEERTYERLAPAKRAAVMVLPIQNNTLTMIREYAVGSERYELTCVKGAIDAGETPEQAALRELQEEIGVGARKITPLRMLYTSPSHMYGSMYVFVAEDLYPSVLEGDEPEPLEPVAVSLAQLNDLIDNAEFGDARVLAALMLFQRQFQQNAA
ncbi:ADP compounds hydrolase NudE [Kingella negevensis]|uniref:ADP compounds hydrolase NudE n=1 Tax=Kingella negevensis TaxID=1522312 RepID=A0A238HHU5_9NEIS|nr:ADP compounds hydrolase NudE [Kingella negevensis]MDK4679357.1 ADP compounds hydrolase NudE [Kingella negevensis]MDK4682923.1 ADP compounds hydrolase NudE [Kingella negevensis]MDK4685497.1 ADP compounds hydrolase NudE [Kingella negevensis]MDK4689607.1 ADP compounds hydrolase NudE [Kingella negevensis]MDK4691122.1 ADP compounds hydrolase NudE [Kingella negevensis]